MSLVSRVLTLPVYILVRLMYRPAMWFAGIDDERAYSKRRER
jgi:hypothetical protein